MYLARLIKPLGVRVIAHRLRHPRRRRARVRRPGHHRARPGRPCAALTHLPGERCKECDAPSGTCGAPDWCAGSSSVPLPEILDAGWQAAGSPGAMTNQLVMYEEEFKQIKAICDRLQRDANAKVGLPHRQERAADRRGRRDRAHRHHVARVAHRRQRRGDGRHRQADRRERVRRPVPRGREDQHPHLDRRQSRHPGRHLRQPPSLGPGAPARARRPPRSWRRSSRRWSKKSAGPGSADSPFAEITDDDIDNLFSD